MKDRVAPVITASKILLVDDQILFREGLVSLFATTPDFEVVGVAGSVQEGRDLALKHRPDIILMDFSLPDGTGLDAARAILEPLPDCKIIFLTVYETDENLFAALRLGAKGYMLKNITGADLLSGLRALSKGEKAISRKMVSSVLDEFSRNNSLSASGLDKQKLLAKISPRELDVLRELETGATNLQIAQRLFLSENTIKHHIRNILNKLEVENRREAMLVARNNAFGSEFSPKRNPLTGEADN
jgi:DNA-binding NarL/FixJ family response regulator